MFGGLTGGGQPRPYVFFADFGCVEDGEELVPFANGTGAFRRDQVAEELADDRVIKLKSATARILTAKKSELYLN